MTAHDTVRQNDTSNPVAPKTGSCVLQRQCACCQHTVAGGECAECRKKRLSLQHQTANQTERATAPPNVHEVLRSPGRPLDPVTRQFMESRFGYDFSRVRVHTDARAAESAQAVNALAYTVGQEVVFGAGQYRPGTASGERLLVHELTHVAQQRDYNTDTLSKLTIGSPDSQIENEASRISQKLFAETEKQGSVIRYPVTLQRHIDPDLFITGENYYFANQGQARIAALARATALGPGHTIIHHPSPTRGQPHYHIVDPVGNHVAGHFFYGRRRPRKERGRRFERERARERAEREVRDLLPGWILSLLTAAALAAIIACFASGACEAAIIIGAAGAAVGAIIIGILGAAGVDITDGEDQVA